MKGLLKNRTLIGILCIVIALIICFGLTPLFNNAMSARGDIVRVRTDIQRGELITSDMLEIVNAGTYNLPPNILMTRDEITGRYALADMQRGDYVLSGKVSAVPLAEFEYLSTLDGTKQAMSVTIKSFAAGVSGKLEAGDIVTLIAADYGDRRETSLPPELQYVYVLAVTAGSGNDKEAVT
jgi:SAF domain.